MSKILLVGSSIFEQWTSAADLLPGHQVINRAIGGTTTRDWLPLLPTTLTQTVPDALCFYCGSNDLNRDYAPTEIVENLAHCQRLAQSHPRAPRYAYFSIIKAPQKVDKWDIIDQINTAVRSQLPADALYIELNDTFWQAGAVLPHYFVEDGLHLTNEAYRAMVHDSAPQLQAWVEKFVKVG